MPPGAQAGWIRHRARQARKSAWTTDELIATMEGAPYVSGMAKRLTEPIYKRVWQASGLPGPAPPVYSVAQPSSFGLQPGYSRRVLVRPEVAKGMRTQWQSVGRDVNALEVLMHEYAHVAQPEAIKPWRMEGGANLWALRNMYPTAEKLGVPVPRINQEIMPQTWNWNYGSYPRESERILRQRGAEQFITRGQFGRR